jgi:glyoxylase I family protein
MAEISGFAHVSLTVSDLEASAAWYERLFEGSIRLMDTDEGDGHRWIFYILPGGVPVGLHAFTDTPSGDRFSERRIGLDHLSFACADTAGVQAWAARCEELGIEHSGIVERPYGVLLVVRDPDNIQLEFYALPG